MGAKPTIYALSSGAGRAGVAVLRVSGPAAGAALSALSGPLPAPRAAALRRIFHPHTRDMLDEALVLWFPAPRSFTGEDVAELHLHGSRAVVSGVLGALAGIDGCRLAEPGAFTRQAFVNGKLDLAEVEALSDLIDASTERQRSLALHQLTAGLGVAVDGWRAQVLRAQALVEAAIDFSDEADVSTDAFAQAAEIVQRLACSIDDALAAGRRGEILREGFRVVIVGAPNAGKSSLLNALSRRDVAIVSDEPGTTRDVIETTLDLDGVPVILTDTAGLRETTSKVELEGIRRTVSRAQSADLVIELVDAAAAGAAENVSELLMNLGISNVPVMRVLSKIDLLATPTVASSCIGISTVSGAGIEPLLKILSDRAAAAVDGETQPLVTRARHRALLEQASAGLGAFLTGDYEQQELRAEDLRAVAFALERLIGRVDIEDVLGEIFGRFCIGK